jgi:hypothetical protein
MQTAGSASEYGGCLLRTTWASDRESQLHFIAPKTCEHALYSTAAAELEMEIQSGGVDLLPTASSRSRDCATDVGQNRISRCSENRLEQGGTTTFRRFPTSSFAGIRFPKPTHSSATCTRLVASEMYSLSEYA